MKNKHFDNINETFKFRADRWKDYSPSVRPSRNEIQVYEQIISASMKTNSNCLLLGATPEIRRTLHDLRLNVTIIDGSEYMVHKMSELVGCYDLKESIVIGDWLNYDFTGKGLDFVLGDHVINMLSPSQYESFIDRVYGLLKDEGSFITRVITIPEKNFYTTAEALHMYNHGKIKYNDFIWIIPRRPPKSGQSWPLQNRPVAGLVFN